ncbi:MAG TPA: VCBS repeat-containing protein, partial [Ignavibacteriales bacterium]|nr:VCBS repeat-containing protein [Ignavibacteriales bacterium]
IYRGEPDDKFQPNRTVQTGLEITAAKRFKTDGDRYEKFAFISRKQKTAGIFHINENGSISVLKKLKLHYNPEYLDVADINNNGKLEMLVSGGAYQGADILAEEDSGIEKYSVFRKDIYAYSFFTDVNNDQFIDIAAFNILENSLVIAYNNYVGGFTIGKKIRLYGNITGLRAADVNLDGYKDIIASEGASLIVLYGDAEGEFRESKTIYPRSPVKKFLISDLNEDGFSDFAYISADGKKLAVLFSKKGGEAYEEMAYLARSGLKEIKLFSSKAYKGLAAISSEGHFYIISELPVIKDNTSLVFSPKPTLISYADIDRNGMADFIFYDEALETVNIIERSSSGIPSFLYSYHLLKKPGRMLTDNPDTKKIDLIFYSKGGRLIEIISFDAETQKFSREDLYAQFPIKDLRLKNIYGEKKSRIAAAYDNAGTIGIELFVYKDFRYRSQISEGYEANAYSANVSVNAGNFSLLFWNISGNNASLNEIIFESKWQSIKEVKRKFNIRFRNDFSALDFTNTLLNDRSNTTASFLKQDINKFIVYSGDKFIGKIAASGLAAGAYADNPEQLYFGEMDFSRLKYLFVYNRQKGYIGRLEPLNGGKNALFQKIAEVPDLFDYFIKNLNFRKYHLVYTDAAEGCIKVKELN